MFLSTLYVCHLFYYCDCAIHGTYMGADKVVAVNIFTHHSKLSFVHELRVNPGCMFKTMYICDYEVQLKLWDNIEGIQ